MNQSIKEVKKIFTEASVDNLYEIITHYQEDQREGVQALIRQAQRVIQRLDEEYARINEMKAFDHQYNTYQYICGIDEAGRGPLAGPVVAAAVIFPSDIDILYLNDSKQVRKEVRDQLYDEIHEKALAVGVGIVSPGRIDEINILQGTYEAMQIALSNLKIKPDILLNDAVTIPNVQIPQIPIVKGDTKSLAIAGASIIAKVTRDRLMETYDTLYEAYQFHKHKGYGTKDHIALIKEHGPSPIHRHSFIKNIVNM